MAAAFEAVPAQLHAALGELLPVLRRRLLELCDLNTVVREMKAAHGRAESAALWERAKVTSESGVVAVVGPNVRAGSAAPRSGCARC
jgi:hypothetical protein